MLIQIFRENQKKRKKKNRANVLTWNICYPPAYLLVIGAHFYQGNKSFCRRIIHLVDTQKLSEKLTFLPPDRHT